MQKDKSHFLSVVVPTYRDEKIILKSTIDEPEPLNVKKSIQEEEIESLYNQVDDEKSFVDLMAEVAENNPDIAGDVLSIKHHENVEIFEDNNFNSVSSADYDNTEIETPNNASEQTLDPTPELLEDEENIIDSNEEIKDSIDDNITEDDTKDEITEIEADNIKGEDTSVEASKEEVEFEGLSHLERLRAEAKSEIQSEADNEQNIIELDENIKEVNKVSDDHLPSEEISETKIEDEEVIDNVLSKMNVPDLRKLARGREDFPIKGREISKANRKVLLEHFKQLK